jgi:hypothetical protein
VQLDLFGDYKSNVAMYPEFQAYFRKHKPPFLAVWGKNDPFFLPPAPKRSTVTFQAPTRASSTPAISPSKRTVTRSLRQSAISCRAPVTRGAWLGEPSLTSSRPVATGQPRNASAAGSPPGHVA